VEVDWKSVLTEVVVGAVVAAAVGGDDGDDDRQQLHHHHHHPPHFPEVDSNVKEDGHCSKMDGVRQERWPSN
jgi:hypothetical protein